MHIFLITILSLGIIAIKTLWIATDARTNKERFSIEMLKTNSVEAVILLLQILSSVFLPWPLTSFTVVLIYFGVIIYIIGFVLAVWARFVMRQHWGAPGMIDKKRQTELVTSGPFKYSRNPIYVGFILLYFGHALATRSYLIVLRIPLLLYFIRSVRQEEKLLIRGYGAKYKTYMQKVPRYL